MHYTNAHDVKKSINIIAYMKKGGNKMNQLNNHFAVCESCGKRLQDIEYIWDIIEDRIVCEDCYNKEEVFK